MKRTGMMMMATLLVAAPAFAGDDDRRERREDRRDVSRAAQRVFDERQDLYRAQQFGNPRDIREESRELRRAERDLQRERQDLARSQWGGGRGYAQSYGDGRNDNRWNDNRWNDGNRSGPGWQRDGWRGQDWHAEQFYRQGNGQGNYRPVVLGRNDPVWRGYDNRYYCRRSDGSTGLIIGGLAGGALGNVIAPGGSKLLGSIIGGSLGAVIGERSDRNRVVCQ
ncbi:hypothetical protein [Sandarakinorhabdus sp.]|uniref:hypothetical protein n=1 Tax=Sandarakinorhabdus sp. TaxID=1916663 RepID=UPI003342CBF7